jgi:hypothetical protein
MTQISKDIAEQVAGAYKLMAERARYRPAAPSDGMGSITVPPEELNLERESLQYAARWWEEEDNHKFHVGCCNHSTRPATIFAIEAARLMCAGHSANKTALELLQLAVEQLKSVMSKPA